MTGELKTINPAVTMSISSPSVVGDAGLAHHDGPVNFSKHAGPLFFTLFTLLLTG